MLTSVQALGLMDDMDDARTIDEVEAIVNQVVEDYGNVFQDPDLIECLRLNRDRLSLTTIAREQSSQNEMVNKLAQLQQQLAAMQIAAQPKVAVVRSSRSYKLLSFDVKWSTKPQVHAIAKILEANFGLNEVVDEGIIVEAMERNRHILETRQTGQKIWNYYKGDHSEGLLMHGNVEKL